MVAIKINYRNIMKTMYVNLVTSIVLNGRKLKSFHFEKEGEKSTFFTLIQFSAEILVKAVRQETEAKRKQK